jgi:hypothetical protein
MPLCKLLSDHVHVERLIREWSQCYEISIGVEMNLGEMSKKGRERMQQIEVELGTDLRGMQEYFRAI